MLGNYVPLDFSRPCPDRYIARHEEGREGIVPFQCLWVRWNSHCHYNETLPWRTVLHTMAFRGNVQPLPMTHEPGRGIAFQPQVSLDGPRFSSSSKDDPENKDTAVEQPGTGTHWKTTVQVKNLAIRIPQARYGCQRAQIKKQNDKV